MYRKNEDRGMKARSTIKMIVGSVRKLALVILGVALLLLLPIAYLKLDVLSSVEISFTRGITLSFKPQPHKEVVIKTAE